MAVIHLFYYLHGSCGSISQIGHRRHGLYLPHNVWILSWKTSKARDDATDEGWKHLEASSLTCLKIDAGYDLSWGSLLEFLHMACQCGVGFLRACGLRVVRLYSVLQRHVSKLTRDKLHHLL